MNGRRVAIAFLAALLCSGFLTWALSRQLSKTAPVAVATRVRRVVVVSKNMQAGDPMDAAALGTVNWAATQALPGAFDNPQQVAGRVLLVPVGAGEPVLAHDLAAAGSGAGILAEIPDGMRAISVRADEVDSVSGFVTPGSLVDVLAMYRAESGSALSSRTVLEKIRVLAVGQTTEPDPQPKPNASGTVTLLVTPQEAGRLAQASSLGRIALILRNASDQTTYSGAPELSPASGEAQLHSARIGVPAAQRLATFRPPTGFTVETIAGGKQTTQMFEGHAQ